MSPAAVLLLLGWGTLVGLDLVSVAQVMIARPIVAGTVAGALLGDWEAGLRVGLLFELFQFDVLPVGAARYPEYGPATVAAVSTAHLLSGALGVGIGTGVGLVTGLAGGASLHVLRVLNTQAVRGAAAALETGDRAVLTRVHAGALLRDAARAALVTAFGLGLAWLAWALVGGAPAAWRVTLPAAAAAGAALAAGMVGLLRLVGRGPNLRWLALGLAGGLAVMWIW